MFKLIRSVFGILDRWAPRLSGWLAYRLFLIPFAKGYSKEELEYLSPFEERSFIYRKKKVYFRFLGHGPYILFCHGWAGKSTQFRILIEQFQDRGYGILLVDFPAHGKSPGRRTSAVQFAEVIGHLLGQFDVEHIVTHSLGGLGFAAFAEKNEVTLKTAVFISLPGISSDTVRIYMEQINAGYHTREVMVNHMQRTFNRAMNDFNASDLMRGRMERTRVLVVHDKEDKRAPGYQGGILAKALDGQLLSTTGLGHMRILKDERVAERIVKFVANER